MTPAELDALEALAAEATPLPWQPCPMKMFLFGPRSEMIASESRRSDQRESGIEPGSVVLRGVGAGLPLEANHDYILAACNAVPALVARIRTLQACLEVETAAHEGCCREVIDLRVKVIPANLATTIRIALENDDYYYGGQREALAFLREHYPETT